MTTEQKMIRAKWTLVLAKQLDDVSQDCRMMVTAAIASTASGALRHRRRGGVAGVQPQEADTENRVSQEVEDAIVALALEQPAFGLLRARRFGAAWGFTRRRAVRVAAPRWRAPKNMPRRLTAFFEDMMRRGLNDLLLVTSDGAPGIIKAIEICFPRAARQRCLAHRMRNLAAKVPEDVWPDFKVRAQAAYQAPSRAIARELAAGVDADYSRKYDSAVACFMDDFEACIAHLRFPVTLSARHPGNDLLERCLSRNAVV